MKEAQATKACKIIPHDVVNLLDRKLNDRRVLHALVTRDDTWKKCHKMAAVDGHPEPLAVQGRHFVPFFSKCHPWQPQNMPNLCISSAFALGKIANV